MRELSSGQKYLAEKYITNKCLQMFDKMVEVCDDYYLSDETGREEIKKQVLRNILTLIKNMLSSSPEHNDDHELFISMCQYSLYQLLYHYEDLEQYCICSIINDSLNYIDDKLHELVDNKL